MIDIFFTLDDIKFGTDKPSLEKAFDLYRAGRVMQVEAGVRSWRAMVIGSQPYQVSVEVDQYDMASCSCYLGQRDIFCKHAVALAIHMVKNGEPLTEEDMHLVHAPICSGTKGELSESKLAATKREITTYLRYIKPYNGPSRIWFAYQSDLSEGCHRLAKVVSELPVSVQTTKLLVNMLLRLDRKLYNGIDDSDGTVGNFIEQVVEVLQEFVAIEPDCAKVFVKLEDRKTFFEWEESLLEYV